MGKMNGEAECHVMIEISFLVSALHRLRGWRIEHNTLFNGLDIALPFSVKSG
jgi:hypothetical protein